MAFMNTYSDYESQVAKCLATELNFAVVLITNELNTNGAVS